MIYTLEFTSVFFSIMIVAVVGSLIVSAITKKDYFSKTYDLCGYGVLLSCIALFFEVGVRYHYLGYKLVKDEHTVCPPPTFVIDSTRYDGDFTYESDKFSIKRVGTNTVIIAQ